MESDIALGLTPICTTVYPESSGKYPFYSRFHFYGIGLRNDYGSLQLTMIETVGAKSSLLVLSRKWLCQASSQLCSKFIRLVGIIADLNKCP